MSNAAEYYLERIWRMATGKPMGDDEDGLKVSGVTLNAENITIPAEMSIDQTTPGTTNGVVINNTPNVAVTAVPANPFGANADEASSTGSISAKLRQLATILTDVYTAASHWLKVSIENMPKGAATSANSFPVVLASDQAAIPASGPAADDAAVSGNPVRVGAHAVNALPAAVANNDTKDLLTDLQGRLIVLLDANPENTLFGNPAAVTDNTAHDVIAAQGVGQRIYVTDVKVTNAHATVGTVVTIQDDTAGTPVIIDQGYAAPAGGGWSSSFRTPRRTGANQKLQVICGTTGSNILVSAGGFRAV